MVHGRTELREISAHKNICCLLLTHFSLETPKRVFANSAESDQTMQNVPSDQGLHCLH